MQHTARRLSRAILFTGIAALGACVAEPPPADQPDAGAAAVQLPDSRQGLQHGYLRTSNGTMPIVYRIEGDIAKIGDDLLVPLASFERNFFATEEEAIAAANSHERAAIMPVGSARWGNTIPYLIDPALPSPQRVLDAIEDWKAKTPYNFVVRTSEPDYITFTVNADDSNCWSALGRQGGPQEIHLASGCKKGQVVHEIGHAVGFYHEQTRSDRDTWVTINWDCIEDDFAPQFKTYIESGRAGGDDGFYDYGSIMHYSRDAFSNGCDTITPKQSGVSIGQRSGLSVGDAHAAWRLYYGLNTVAGSGPYVTAYRNANFGGASQKFLPSVYRASLDELDKVGDNAITSLQIPPGLSVTLCSDEGLGVCRDFNANVTDLAADIDDKTSYVVVSRAATAYRDFNLTGVSQTFHTGYYYANQSQLGTVGNDAISSLLVPPGILVELCSEEWGFDCQNYSGIVNSVGTLLNDRASRVKVFDAVTVFRDPGFSGPSDTYLPGTFTGGVNVPLDQVSSIVVGQFLRARVCIANGACANLTGDVNFLGAGLNDKITQLTVEYP